MHFISKDFSNSLLPTKKTFLLFIRGYIYLMIGTLRNKPNLPIFKKFQLIIYCLDVDFSIIFIEGRFFISSAALPI